MKTAQFNRFTLDLPDSAVWACAHSGACDDDVDTWHDKITFSHINDALLASELREYGGWNPVELEDRIENEKRLLWLAAWQIREDIESEEK